ncbi:hypothetical protein A3A49_00555 [Candidatus Curtissbacteria bacterium RIFCSPLOWO2_01_FULL_38_11b]|uniref:VTT domain-containing protein n=1 Tax=Candidatus Curtissbacteria bacterium RIFCSPLOWO2_01_FULL_38_11b TaxID=1797725 RepID=A0A1F5H019_9BACT|nr:MAG: hypothetical protein A3A49_00555 [Candidatus Curtissbacteria bacterium RIFCSPLOWO2_01_FULL_38_11b]
MFELIETYSYLGLFAILFIEEAGVFLPIPGDILIASVAALPSSNYFLTVLTVIGATLTGSTILFTLSKKFGHHIIRGDSQVRLGHNLLVKYGKYIKVTPKKINKIEKWFEKYGGLAIVIGRLIPGLRIVTPVVAGLLRVSYKTFWLYTTLAALIWVNIYFVIGRFFGNILTKLLIN